MNTAEIARLTALLDAIHTAITAILEGGQSVTVGDVSYTEASLPALHAYEKQTRKDLARAAGTRPIVVGVDFSGLRR